MFMSKGGQSQAVHRECQRFWRMDEETRQDNPGNQLLAPSLHIILRHETISRSRKNVSQYDSPFKEPRQGRMEEFHGRVNFQTFLQDAVHISGFWINLPQWRKLGEENDLQSSTNHPLSMVLSPFLPPRQKKRAPEKTRHGRDDGQY